MKSYYEILGISDNADAVTIKKAYRSLVKQYHPDIYKGEDRDTKFQEIQKAYDVLSDEDQRAAYDRTGHQGFEQQQKYGGRPGGFGGSYQDFGGFTNFDNFGSQFKTVNFSDIPLWKKLFIFAGLAILAIIIVIGFIVVSIVRGIIYIINEIFK